ncbi:hypothetical protein [Alteribacillus iranensis]|uniref:Uncharacterized protein n=1 Tax=Alteribacillus iranensis TaxID=930128 RepID=A0A1I2B2M0_9BACI|nr:hypothetical protein [Alteribacillus iranensis]SFE50138.1 hypothetical protein SAMN05192532_10237 [Alteribacillus iranensis]
MLLETKTSSRRSMTITELEKKAAELDIDTRYKNVYEVAREVKEVEMKIDAARLGISTDGKDLDTLALDIRKARGKL